MNLIKFSKINIEKKDLVTVKKIISSGWLTHGKYTNLFENELKKFTSAKYSVTVSSCTAALHLSCLALDFKKGDEVIVPAQTHTATAHAVEYTGAKAVLVDVDSITGNISYNKFIKKVNRKTKGVIVVHMAGLPCEIKKIINFCNKKKIKVIEDCAHALGTRIDNKHVGNFGVSGCFSFYPTKQITTGEGGALITNNIKIYKKIKMLKAFGIDKDINQRSKPGVYDVKDLGFNFRMTDFQAALGYFQLKRYKKNLKRRHEIAKRYVNNLKSNKNIVHMPYSRNCSFFIFQIFTKKRDKLISHLKEKKIQFSIHYANSLNKMTYYKKKYNLKNKSFINAVEYGLTSISLPNYPKLKNKEVDYICNTINRFY
tara:strand:+ start:2096 stop:3205 length:1110 start_codon:yes stop_codon:yes gene_type:complete